jgi:2-dehydro-3-deoxyphosphogluconate aldolase/(4S)-4-hydroxy-2-oxoglutarate aldolase
VNPLAATHRAPVPELVSGSGIVAIARSVAEDVMESLAAALLDAGIHALELTLNVPIDRALRGIEAVARRFDGAELLVGAGTVLSIEAAGLAVDAGARFVVMPHTDPELIRWAADKGIPVFPGGLSPTEILAAWRAGATAVKLFPASVAGPAAIRELRGPLPDIPLIPTGGISADNAGGFIEAGAVALGVGGWLIGDAAPPGVTKRGRRIVDVVAEARA